MVWKDQPGASPSFGAWQLQRRWRSSYFTNLALIALVLFAAEIAITASRGRAQLVPKEPSGNAWPRPAVPQTGPHALPSLALPNSVTLIHNGGNLACRQISKVGHYPAVRPLKPTRTFRLRQKTQRPRRYKGRGFSVSVVNLVSWQYGYYAPTPSRRHTALPITTGGLYSTTSTSPCATKRSSLS